jgi:ABC-type transport system substrate-binding protein
MGLARLALLFIPCFCTVDTSHADGVRVGVSEIQDLSLLAAQDGISRILQSALYSSIAEQPSGVFKLKKEVPGVLTIAHEQDVSCADGRELTTQDLVFSIEQCLKIRGQSAVVERMGDTNILSDAAPGIVVRGTDTVLDGVASCPLMRSWAMSIFGERGGRVDTSVGCGAFKVESITPGRKIALVSKGVREGTIDTITVQKMSGDSPRLSLLRRADIDIFLDPTQDEQLSMSEDPTLATIQCDGFAVATRRVLRVQCGPQFFASLLRWEHGSSHEHN